MQKYGLIIFLFLSPLLIYSCIFEDDSVGPNQPPKIVSFSPDWQIGTLRIPADSVSLNIRAVDPEKDNIRYSFVLIDSVGGIDSVISDSDSAVFYARESGIYNIEGRAYDSDHFGKRSWFIKVRERINTPPVITEWTPGSKTVQFLVGSLVNFSFKVSDDHPENLVYGYKMGGLQSSLFLLTRNSATDFCRMVLIILKGLFSMESMPILWGGILRSAEIPTLSLRPEYVILTAVPAMKSVQLS